MNDVGKLVAGRYRLGRRIGSGAMGVVWQALDERLHRTVAVKQLLLAPGLTAAQTEEAHQRAMREGRIAARLSHPAAITVYDVTEDDGQPWLIMEYLPSRSLADVLDTAGSLPPEQVARIGAQIAGALAKAHEAGIVHRDVKPGNVLIAEDGTVKITDFGISRAIGDVTVTATGMLAGTPAYLAPEMAMGEHPAPPSDVFSLGSTLYAAVEGAPPFGSSDNQLATLHAVAAARMNAPRRSGPLTPVLAEVLRPTPAERPTMAQAQSALQAVAAGQPVPAEMFGEPAAGVAAPPHQQQPEHPAPAQPTRAQPSPTRLDARPMAEPAAATREPRRQHTRDRPPRWRTILIGTVAIAVAAALGILVANAMMSSAHTGSTAPKANAETLTPVTVTASPSRHPSTTTHATTSAPPSGVTDEQVEQFVRSYYGKLPQRTRSAWHMLGASVRHDSGGYGKYEKFWSSISDVTVRRVTPSGEHAADVLIRFTKRKPEHDQGHDGDGDHHDHGDHAKKDRDKKDHENEKHENGKRVTTNELYAISVQQDDGTLKITKAKLLTSQGNG